MDSHRNALRDDIPSSLGNALYQTGRNALLYPFRNPETTAEFGLSMAPGSGEAMSARDAWNASGAGGNALMAGNYGEAASNYGNMLLGVAGAVPGLGIITRGTKRGAAWMDRNLPEGFNRLLDGMMPSDPKNTTNIFAGPTAKTADHTALAKAQEMAAAGVNRDAIHAQTGWHQGVDGKWRFEIDDSQMGVKIPKNADSGSFHAYPTAVDHSALYEAYPGMRRDRVNFDAREDSSSFLAEADPRALGVKPRDTTIGVKGRKMMMQNTIIPHKVNKVRGDVGHEFQHNVQSREGFSQGTSPHTVMSELDEAGSPEYRQLYADVFSGRYGQGNDPSFKAALAKLDDMTHNEMMDGYRRTSGEVEARNVATRMNMTAAERRAKAPWHTQDVPDEQQIVRHR